MRCLNKKFEHLMGTLTFLLRMSLHAEMKLSGTAVCIRIVMNV
jgi:hypothetical protein